MVVEGGGEFSVSKFPVEVDGWHVPLIDDCDDVESCLGLDDALSLANSSSYMTPNIERCSER